MSRSYGSSYKDIILAEIMDAEWENVGSGVSTGRKVSRKLVHLKSGYISHCNGRIPTDPAL